MSRVKDKNVLALSLLVGAPQDWVNNFYLYSSAQQEVALNLIITQDRAFNDFEITLLVNLLVKQHDVSQEQAEQIMRQILKVSQTDHTFQRAIFLLVEVSNRFANIEEGLQTAAVAKLLDSYWIKQDPEDVLKGFNKKAISDNWSGICDTLLEGSIHPVDVLPAYQTLCQLFVQKKLLTPSLEVLYQKVKDQLLDNTVYCNLLQFVGHNPVIGFKPQGMIKAFDDLLTEAHASRSS